MASKNQRFATDLVDAVDTTPEAQPRAGRLGVSMLTGRSNRLAELATGSVINRTSELVDPARCRMWAGHNREYDALSEIRCHDLIDSMKAQGKQEVAAIARRVRDDLDHEFEVICGARRHWSVSWLRAHNYPDFRFLIEVRELTDEEAFRLSDLENRARDDISDLERARDYVRALEHYYAGHQAAMAERMRVTASWLSRYLDLARLPPPIVASFANPHELGIRNVAALKPLLKPEDRRRRVIAEAERIAAGRMAGQVAPSTISDTIRLLAAAADPPKKTGAPKRTGLVTHTIASAAGKPILKVETGGRSLALTLPVRSGATRAEVDAAIATVLDQHWS